jgi:cation diffusion facilitator family transporter
MKTRNQKIKYVALLGISCNIFLFTIKLIVGLLSQSQAMIADGLNSAGDVFASFMTYIGNRIAEKPNDKDHPYGHGKAEYIFSMIISFSLILVALTIIKRAFNALQEQEAFLFTPWLIVVALVTIMIKLLLFLYTSRIGHTYNSLLALANSEDHRNDVFITLFTLLSIVTGYFSLYIIDAIVGISIGFWIGYTGFRIFTSAYYVLMDTNIDPSIKEGFVASIEKIDGVDHVDAITSKPIGLQFLLIVKISVDAEMTIREGHSIGDQVKEYLIQNESVDDVIVHLNPTQDHPQKNYLK